MSWMAAPTKDFHVFVFKIFAFNGITLIATFGIARDLYRRCKYIVYNSYGPPVGNHIINCEPKLPYIFVFYFYFFLEVPDQNCHSTRPRMEFRR